ncbi:hypothetical protein HQ865_20460 [Mucilaginibacter mali]|uniref:MG2 domain-containing protein n=1 Tax=Mucilaginibacter mali TaxID=2740462 RepID=A0A7D4TX49_9SPHI|nr:hypothetical protein [Mucilaginibacter mali]QKJ32035.1 hypothetical protein HQ865_20460 [Mucilaginibacter mali]
MKETHHKIKKTLLLLAVIVFVPFILRAQAQTNIQASFEKYSSTVLQEKVYTHTDRTFYMTGEIIWFKLYVVDAGKNKPLDVSKLAYVDVLDAGDSPVLQAKIALKNGSGGGSLYIPVTLGNGNYKLRAYTNWMKNFSPDLYFEKQLTIVNPLVSPDAPVKLAKADADIQFFPEGGALVNGISSTVGFKVTGIDGRGINVNGVIINQRSDTVARFSTANFGIGRFAFTPVANNTYKAVMRIGADNVLIKPLPAANTTGYVMQVSDDGGKQLQVKISGTNTGDVYLLAHNGSRVTIAQQARADGSTVNIDKDKLGEGINHITLFNAERAAVAERLYFKRPAVLNINADMQLQRGTRKKMNVYLTAKGSDGSAQAADMSIAVYRIDSLNKTPGTDIASYLWLASELKGNIESPEYYFNNVNPATNQALDNLLLTQGWSRFKWDDVLSSRMPSFSFLPEYNGHLVTGKITTRDGTPAKNKNVYLAVISKKPQLYGATADAAGEVVFNTRELYGNNEIVVQPNTQVDTIGYRITINSPFSERYSSTKLSPFYIDKILSRQLDDNSVTMQVQNLYRPENLRQFSTAGIDSSGFYANLYRPYLLDKFTRFTTMEEVLREYVSEVNVVKSGPHFRIKVLSPIGKDQFLEGDPLVLLDGIPVFNMDKVIAIDPLKIKRLETVNRQYYNGAVDASGILSFTSYKTDLGGQELDPRSIVLDYEGMQLKREFYSPVYDTPDQQNSRLPDFRNLLYWSPNVNTGADGKTQASFYTSDKTGRYIGVVQGIGANGQSGVKYFTFEVNK